jgi:hypothetical protein
MKLAGIPVMVIILRSTYSTMVGEEHTIMCLSYGTSYYIIRHYGMICGHTIREIIGR